MGEVGLLTIVIALGIGVVIWRGSLALVRLLATPPPRPDPEEVMEVDLDFLCTVCGTEVTMRALNVNEASPPKHCREEMVAVWRPHPQA
jgi:hypothetical protein